MQRDLVEERRWVTLEEYQEGLALAQLMPGPLAAQLAIYLGWVRFGVPGATLVALAFTLPSLLIVMALSALYVKYGGISWMRGAFYGIGAAVIGIIARSAVKLVKSTIKRDRLLWLLFTVSALFTAWTESELVWLFLAAGVLTMVLKTRFRPAFAPAVVPLWLPVWLMSGTSGPASFGVLAQIFVFFLEAGAFVFGSGLAIVPFLHAGVVKDLHWLNEQQFLDAVAVAMITPGPVVITVAFIGYLVAGPLGALAPPLPFSSRVICWSSFQRPISGGSPLTKAYVPLWTASPPRPSGRSREPPLYSGSAPSSIGRQQSWHVSPISQYGRYPACPNRFLYLPPALSASSWLHDD
jgi:chromate transporter